MPPAPTAVDLLCVIAEPTRLRLLNCLAAAPLFVSDLQALLDVPQPTVSRHLAVLRQAGVVQDTPVGSYVLYRLRSDTGTTGRLIHTVLDAVLVDERLQVERRHARDRSRSRAGSSGLTSSSVGA